MSTTPTVHKVIEYGILSRHLAFESLRKRKKESFSRNVFTSNENTAEFYSGQHVGGSLI